MRRGILLKGVTFAVLFLIALSIFSGSSNVVKNNSESGLSTGANSKFDTPFVGGLRKILSNTGDRYAEDVGDGLAEHEDYSKEEEKMVHDAHLDESHVPIPATDEAAAAEVAGAVIDSNAYAEDALSESKLKSGSKSNSKSNSNSNSNSKSKSNTKAGAVAGGAVAGGATDKFHLNENPFALSQQLAQSYKRENATILTLCREEDLRDIIKTIRQLEDRFNRYFHYDWVFLNNGPLSKEFQEKVSKIVSGTAKFGEIPKEHWSYPDFIDLDKAAEERQKMANDGVIYADSESYRHMCRFNSGFFYKHPLLLDYKYYWRVEPHVNFWCDVMEDPFKVLREENKIYGFTITIHEFKRTIETLWETTKEFLKLNPEYVHPNNLMNFISDDEGETYNLCHFWSNFEIADMDFWRSAAYEEYFEHLDKAGGFFYERWGDAPVHSIAASLFLEKEKIHFFKEIGYTHSVYTMCPIEDSVFDKHRCSCDKNHDFTFDGYACGIEFFNAMGWEKPANWKQYAN